MVVYFGLKMNVGSTRRDYSIMALYPSKKEEDITPSAGLTRRRDITEEVFENPFLHIYVPQRNRRLASISGCRLLVLKGFERFAEGDSIKIFGSSNMIGLLHQAPSTRAYDHKIVKNGERTIPLLNRADHLAYVIHSYYSRNIKKQGRIRQVRKRFPQLDYIIAQSRVDFR